MRPLCILFVCQNVMHAVSFLSWLIVLHKYLLFVVNIFQTFSFKFDERFSIDLSIEDGKCEENDKNEYMRFS